MAFDDRVRSGLRDQASDVAPDLDANLDQIQRRSEHSSNTRKAVAVGSAVVLLLAIVALPFGSTGPLGVLTNLFPAGLQPTAPPMSVIGTWHVRREAGPSPSASTYNGDWSLSFDQDNRLNVTTPDPFASQLTGGSMGYVWALTADGLVTNLFSREGIAECAGPGTYRWTASAESLVLVPIIDHCDLRVAVLTPGEWTRAGR